MSKETIFDLGSGTVSGVHVLGQDSVGNWKAEIRVAESSCDFNHYIVVAPSQTMLLELIKVLYRRKK